MRTAGSKLSRRLLGAVVAMAAAMPLHALDEPSYWLRLDPPVLQDSISYPRAVTSDPHTGEIFVCDTRRNRIVIFDRNALFDYQIHGGDRFTAPIDLAVDPQGYLLVVANRNQRRTLIELDFDGLFLREIVLSGIPDDAVVPMLMSVAISHDGLRLYLLDTANLVLWVAQRDGTVNRMVDLAEGLDEDARIDQILGKVDLYGERVLVAAPMLGQIWLFDVDGNPLERTGMKGTGPCRLAFPTAAAIDRNGDLIVLDRQRMYLMRWNPRDNRCLAEYYGPGTAAGYFYYPMDLSLDGNGRLFVAQGWEGRVQVYRGLAPALALTEPATEAGQSTAADRQPPGVRRQRH